MATTSTIKGVNDIARELSSAGGAVTTRATINWEDYNYPPFLRLIHFKLSELDGAPRSVARLVHWTYLLMLGTLCWNFLATCVLAGFGIRFKGLHIAYSIFNIIIGASLGLYAFHSGYKGVATSDGGMMTKYCLVQGVLVLLFFLMSLLGVLNWNGWLRLPEAGADRSGARGFWIFAVVLESLLWTAAYLLGGVAIYYVQRYNSKGPMAFARRGRGMARAGKQAAVTLSKL